MKVMFIQLEPQLRCQEPEKVFTATEEPCACSIVDLCLGSVEAFESKLLIRLIALFVGLQEAGVEEFAVRVEVRVQLRFRKTSGNVEEVDEEGEKDGSRDNNLQML